MILDNFFELGILIKYRFLDFLQIPLNAKMEILRQSLSLGYNEW